MKTYLSLRKAIISDLYIALSFGMTYFRILLIFVASTLIFIDLAANLYYVVTLIVSIMGLDYFDGVLFRKSILHNITHLRIKRRLLDSAADKFVTHVGCISLLIIEPSFIWVYISILVRDVIISAYNLIKFKKNVIIYPGKWAKIAAMFIGITVISFLVNSPTYLLISIIIIMLALSLLALYEYINKYRNYNGDLFKIDDEIIEIL